MKYYFIRFCVYKNFRVKFDAKSIRDYTQLANVETSDSITV